MAMGLQGNEETMGLSARLLFTVLVTLFAHPIYTSIRNLYFHPLSKFPGPKTWCMSRLPYLLSLLGGGLLDDMTSIHEQYGDIVRLAPDEFSFATKEAWQEIYVHRPGHKNFIKSETWYKAPQGMPQNIVTATNPADHSRMRKMLTNSFSEKTLQGQEPVIESYMDLAIARFRAMAIAGDTKDAGVVLNMLDWLNYFTIDIIGDLGFGESFNCLRDSQYHEWVRTLYNFLKGMVFAAATRFYPSVEYIVFALLPSSIIQRQKRHTEFANERINRRLNMETDRPDFITPIMRENPDFKNMSIEEIQSNAAILMVAGSETTATTLAGMMTYLVQNREPLHKITAEVRARFNKEENITIAATKELPYLNASINEALRLCNSVPGGLPRVVGEGGDTICNVFVPEHTTVSVRPWIIARSSRYFHRPNAFIPERWLPINEGRPSDPANDQLQASNPFSIGWANCMGRHLAWAELRIFMARFLWAFNFESEGPPLDWTKLKTYIIVQKEPVMVRIKSRPGA